MAWWLFQNVVFTAGLALAVAMICRIGSIGPVARHALWLVVLVKFVTPPLVVWPWSAPDPLRVAALEMHVDDRHDAAADRAFIDLDATAPSIDAGVTSATMSDRAAAAQLDGEPALAFAIAWPWLLALWLAGSLGLLAIEGVRLGRLARCVRRGRPADIGLERRVTTLCARLEMRPVAVRVVPGGAPPAVWCFGRPQVLWPEHLGAAAPDLCVDALLLHELAHVKRRDHIVGWIELVAGVVWWWNPLFWYVRSALREQAELACDAWVISTLPNGRRAYAESLLVLSGAAPQRASMAVVGVRASSRRILERRLVMIMQGRAPLRLTRVGLVSLALAAALVLPGWAASQDPPPLPPPPPPAPVAVPQNPPTKPPPPPPARVETPKPPPPPPAARAPRLREVVAPPTGRQSLRLHIDRKDELPADGVELVRAFETEVEAIQREADQRVAARHDAVVKALQALQEEHTKAGRLDEAIKIRDYLRAGLPVMARRPIPRKGGVR
jgi:beta-lactamase regulating signal transducer with metallopeptidase domain